MIFLRHPKPEVADGLCYGRLDLEIAQIGHSQIEYAMAATPKVSRILASPARRCRKLALSLAERDGIEVVFDHRLWEMDMGAWEGKFWRELDRSLTEPWMKDPFNLPTPDGESFRDVQERVLQAIEPADNETAIVCHAGPIRATQMAFEGKTFRQVFDVTPPYAEPIVITKP